MQAMRPMTQRRVITRRFPARRPITTGPYLSRAGTRDESLFEDEGEDSASASAPAATGFADVGEGYADVELEDGGV